MAVVQIRNVPDDEYWALKREAKDRKMLFNDYLLQLLRRAQPGGGDDTGQPR